MKKTFINIKGSGLRALIGGFALLALLSFVLPQAAQAAGVGTSGGATIYNTVKVTYTAGTGTLFANSTVTLTVSTVATAPTITPSPTSQTVSAGIGTNAITYTYTVLSNSNGPDTYTASGLTDTPSGISAATGESITTSVVHLWAGTVTAATGITSITVPYNTATAGGLTTGATIKINGNTYTVGTITTGTAASTNGSGNLVPEVGDTIALTKIAGADASIAVGSQAGEYKAASLAIAFTTGTPTTPGTSGTYTTTYTIKTTSVVPSQSSSTATSVVTTVLSPTVTIVKTVVSNDPLGNTIVKPGDILTYTMTVTNGSTTGSVSSVTVIDPVPAYTTYVAASTTLNGIAVTDNAGASWVVAGLTVDDNPTRTAGSVGTGTLLAHNGTPATAGIAVIVYKVTVN
jgi:uncharacterized repeat protein (TIGR01451 family)